MLNAATFNCVGTYTVELTENLQYKATFDAGSEHVSKEFPTLAKVNDWLISMGVSMKKGELFKHARSVQLTGKGDVAMEKAVNTLLSKENLTKTVSGMQPAELIAEAQKTVSDVTADLMTVTKPSFATMKSSTMCLHRGSFNTFVTLGATTSALSGIMLGRTAWNGKLHVVQIVLTSDPVEMLLGDEKVASVCRDLQLIQCGILVKGPEEDWSHRIEEFLLRFQSCSTSMFVCVDYSKNTTGEVFCWELNNVPESEAEINLPDRVSPSWTTQPQDVSRRMRYNICWLRDFASSHMDAVTKKICQAVLSHLHKESDLDLTGEKKEQNVTSGHQMDFVQHAIPADGMCGWHSILAALDLERYLSIPRESSGYARSRLMQQTEEMAARDLHKKTCDNALLQCDQQFHKDILRDTGSNNVFFDASLSTSRAEKSGRCEAALHVTPCVRPSHPIYSVQMKRYLVPEEFLAAQGMWRVDSENMTVWDDMVKANNGKFAQDLAGNGFSSTVAQSAFLACLISCRAWRDVQLQSPGHATASSSKALSSAQGPGIQEVPEPLKSGHAKNEVAENHAIVPPRRRLRGKTKVKPSPGPSPKPSPKKRKNKNGQGRGNKRADGKKKSASIYEKELIMATYQSAIDRGLPKPVDEVKHMAGYFDGCLCASKWKKARKEQQWTLLVEAAPQLTKRYREVPNSLRRILNFKKFKHSIAAPQKIEQIHMPMPLQTVVEDMVMEKITVGEEVTMQYVKSVLIYCCQMWNEVVGTMQHRLKPKALELLRDSDTALAELNDKDVEQRVDNLISKTQDLLRPIRIADNDATILQIGLHLIGCCLEGGDVEKVIDNLQRSRGCMNSLLHLDELPEFDGAEDDTVRHMRMQELAGEQSFVWTIQDDDASDPPSTRIPLPTWMGTVIEMRVCRFVTDHDKWQTAIEKRGVLGKTLTASQQQRFDAWQADCVQRLVFNKRRQCFVSEAKQVTKDCLAFQLHLDPEPENLCVSNGTAGNAKKFRLVLLKKEKAQTPSDTVPGVLDQPVSQDVVKEMEEEKKKQKPKAGFEEEEGEEDQLMSEHQIRELEEEKFADESACMDPEEEIAIMADSDDEIDLGELGVPEKTKVTRVKSFFSRPAWVRLEKMGLTMIPNHIGKCLICCHQTTMQWQGYYPNASATLSCSWGKKTKRKEEEAILRVIRGILESHCDANPKDKIWRKQLETVKTAQSTMSF
eukprot:Skav203833  [mRNA]  locus=scaffold4932:4041:17810:+ [translate_table: standard]